MSTHPNRVDLEILAAWNKAGEKAITSMLKQVLKEEEEREAIEAGADCAEAEIDQDRCV